MDGVLRQHQLQEEEETEAGGRGALVREHSLTDRQLERITVLCGWTCFGGTFASGEAIAVIKIADHLQNKRKGDVALAIARSKSFYGIAKCR